MRKAIVPIIAAATFLGGACSNNGEQSSPSTPESMPSTIVEVDSSLSMDTTIPTTSLPQVESTSTEAPLEPSTVTTIATETSSEPVQYSAEEYVESPQRAEFLESLVKTEAQRAIGACVTNANVTCFWFDGGNGTVTTGPIGDSPEAVSDSMLTISALQADGSILYMEIGGIVDDPVNPTYAGFQPSDIRVYNVGENQDDTSTAKVFRFAKSNPFSTTYEKPAPTENSDLSRIGGDVNWVSDTMNYVANSRVSSEGFASAEAVEGSVAVTAIDLEARSIIVDYVNKFIVSE